MIAPEFLMTITIDPDQLPRNRILRAAKKGAIEPPSTSDSQAESSRRYRAGLTGSFGSQIDISAALELGLIHGAA
jgi:hypothetical protein